jgi:hypothetical protein
MVAHLLLFPACYLSRRQRSLRLALLIEGPWGALFAVELLGGFWAWFDAACEYCEESWIDG